MIQYTFRSPQPEDHFIHLEVRFPTAGTNTMELQLPAWRPGRYELGNFAKNVRNFRVSNGNGEALSFGKVTKDRWLVNCEGQSEVVAHYEYFANQFDAGSCVLNLEQMYVNPVHCCLYSPGREEEECIIKLEVAEDYEVAIALPQTAPHTFSAKGFQALADSPFIASNSLQHRDFHCGGVRFHVWFQGEVKPDWDRVLRDLEAYTKPQLEIFGDFPVDEYHYLYQIAPYATYHGVEHLTSTVISLGPSYDVMEKKYEDFLGVSSHELFHSWNIKSIRPIEMMPYDFSGENHSKLGYVAEGVTTYYGDLMLFRGGVFDETQYYKELNRVLQRHFDNHGRLNMSVADSSYDTWLDGYVAGIPGRKVSIYVEGCLNALMTDLMIRRETNDQSSLDHVMRRLYQEFGKEGLGYSEADYRRIVTEIGGEKLNTIFDRFLYGTDDYSEMLSELLSHVGLELRGDASKAFHESALGFMVMPTGDKQEVRSVYPGSPAQKAGLVPGDRIQAINGFGVKSDVDRWTSYFGQELQRFIVLRDNQLKKIELAPDGATWHRTWTVHRTTDSQGSNWNSFKAWSGQ